MGILKSLEFPIVQRNVLGKDKIFPSYTERRRWKYRTLLHFTVVFVAKV